MNSDERKTKYQSTRGEFDETQTASWRHQKVFKSSRRLAQGSKSAKSHKKNAENPQMGPIALGKIFLSLKHKAKLFGNNLWNCFEKKLHSAEKSRSGDTLVSNNFEDTVKYVFLTV